MNKYAFFLLLVSAAFAQTADTVSFVNFENREVGVYGNDAAKEDFKRNSTDKSWWYAMEKNNGEFQKNETLQILQSTVCKIVHFVNYRWQSFPKIVIPATLIPCKKWYFKKTSR